jgi:hypothetical protein
MMKSIIILVLFCAITIPGCISKNDSDKNAIKQDSILTKPETVIPVMDEILFAGMIGNKSGLYKYNFSTKNYERFWQNDKEEVVELSYSPDKKSAFMLTAQQSGKKGVFPFIDKVKLYSINLDSDSIRFIENIGSGLQVFSDWENNNSFKVFLHVIDATVAKYVEQKIKTYDASDQKLYDENKKYDLAKEGYPQFPNVKKNLTSPNNKYSVLSIDSAQTQIYLVDAGKNNESVLITRQNQKLNMVDWSDNGKILVFNTVDIAPGNETLYDLEPNTSKLFIYSLTDKTIIKLFDGGGKKNFTLNGNYIMFDDGFKEQAKILIYDFNTGQMIDSIKISGGCGMKNVPTIPDYGA